MRLLITMLVVVLAGCDSQPVENAMVTDDLLNGFVRIDKAKIMFFGDKGWSPWMEIDVGSGKKIMEIFRKCPVIHYDSSGSPSPSLPPPNWAVKFMFEDKKELEIEILGSGSLVRVEVENSTEILEAELKQKELVALLEDLETSTSD